MSSPLEIPTHQELMEVAKSSALARSSKLDDGSFAPGFMPDVLAGMIAGLAQEAIQRALTLHSRTFFSTAAGEHLDTLANDHFGLVRQEAVKAIGIVTFSRPTSAGGDVAIVAGTKLETSDGTGFTTDSEVILTGLSISVNVTADVAGEAGIVSAATITVIVEALSDDTVDVSNTERTTGGLDAETDPAFRDRVRNFFATIRRATVPAVAFGALQTPGVVQSSVEETAHVLQSIDHSILSATADAEVDGVWLPKGSYEFVRLVIAYEAVLADSETLTVDANLQDATDAMGTGAADFGAAISSLVVETAPGAGGPHTINGKTTLLVDVTSAEDFLRAQATLTTSSTGTVTWAAILEWQHVLSKTNVYVSDAAGGASSALLTAVTTELDNWRAAGVPVAVAGASVVTQTIDLTVTFAAGFDTSDTRDAITVAVVALVNALAIGATLFKSQIVKAASIEGVNNVVVSDPAGDVAPTANQVIRTASDGSDVTFL